MTRFWNNVLREPLRKFLLRILIFTEKKSEEKPSSARQEQILRHDIHVPPILVALGSSLILLAVLLIETGWSWKFFLSLSILVLLVLFLFIFYLKHDFPKLVQDDESVMLLGTLMILFVMIMGLIKNWTLSIYLTPLPSAAILCAMLIHPRLAVVMSLILTMIFAIMHQFSFDCFFLGFFGSMAGVSSAIYIRTHRDFIRAGGLIALINFLSFTCLTFLYNYPLKDFLWGTLWITLNGFLSAILALGILPFLESFFSRVTPLKLLELADFNQPLLKRLMMEAPGTYHHSLIMATLAESAAQAIEANPLLCRVGAYYHDIGKLVKPEYFIENQIGLNPHSNLAPALSTLVVISHIKEGIALARSANLPSEIINFIPMHHGTSCVEYFYHQAREDVHDELFRNQGDNRAGMAEVEDENYRYPGPKPESKETAILMLADSVEAAARTIDEPTHQRFKDLVENIIRKKFVDGQLSHSLLTLSDFSKLQDAFVNTLTSIYHARIEYPEDDSR